MIVDSITGALSLLLTDPIVWVYIFGGTFYGVFIGAVPGMGTTLGYTLLIPLSLIIDPVYTICMLLGLAVGSQFGNSIPAILVGVPGTPSAILTVMDGHALYRRGKGDTALVAAWLGSLGGQYLGIPLFVLLVVPLANFAYVFQNPELWGMYCLGIAAVISIASKDTIKGLISASLGLAIGLVGIDPLSGRERFTFNITGLRGGLTAAAVVVGVLALGEIFRQTRQAYQWGGTTAGKAVTGKRETVRESLRELRAGGGRELLPAVVGGSLIGTFVGAIPGAGATPASLIAYQQAKLLSKRPREFGDGSTTGIMANESSANASSSGELIPTLALGIPGSGSMLILLSLLIAQGITPGPFLMSQNPDLLNAAVAGLFGGCIIMTFLFLPVARWMAKVASLDRSLVMVSAITVVVIGMFSLRNSLVDVYVLVGAGVLGYLLYRFGFSAPAAALAFILSSGFERSLRFGLELGDGTWGTMMRRPVTLSLVIIAILLLAFSLWKDVSAARKERAERDTEPRVDEQVVE